MGVPGRGPPAHPFGLTVSYVHERLFEARDAQTMD